MNKNKEKNQINNMYNNVLSDAFLIALKNKEFHTANFLLDKGLNINETDKNGETILFHFVDEPSVVKWLMDKNIDVNIQNNKGQTVLFRSILCNYEVSQMLIDAGANVNLRDNENNDVWDACNDGEFTDLVGANKIDHLFLLVANGFKTGNNNRKYSHWMEAGFFFKNNKLLDYLLSNGLDINHIDAYGNSYQTAIHDSNWGLNYLISRDFNVNLIDGNGNSPLFLEAKDYECSLDIMDESIEDSYYNSFCLLIKNGAVFNEKDLKELSQETIVKVNYLMRKDKLVQLYKIAEML